MTHALADSISVRFPKPDFAVDKKVLFHVLSLALLALVLLGHQISAHAQLDGERQIDLYTLKGGTGLGEFGGMFGYGDLVTLKAYVTYHDWPQQNLMVTFQVLNPLNETVLIFVTETDEDGVAETTFRIPEVSASVGLWTAISSVDVACEIVWDTLIFRVSSPVGGKTTAIKQPHGLYVYFAVVGILALGLIASKRGVCASRKHPFTVLSRLAMLRA